MIRLMTRGVKRKGWGAAKEGTAAIEFAIVAPIFIVLMFSIFEIGWFFFVNAIADSAVIHASRLVRTGQVQGLGTSQSAQDAFKAVVCQRVKVFGSCDTQLVVEVHNFGNSFAALEADTSQPLCSDTVTNPNDIAYEPGEELDIVRVRVCLLYRTINPLVGFYGIGAGVDLEEGDTGKKRIITQSIVRNEPFERNNGGGG